MIDHQGSFFAPATKPEFRVERCPRYGDMGWSNVVNENGDIVLSYRMDSPGQQMCFNSRATCQLWIDQHPFFEVFEYTRASTGDAFERETFSIFSDFVKDENPGEAFAELVDSMARALDRRDQS